MTLNYARQASASYLRATLEALYGQRDVSEVRLRDEWLARIRSDARLHWRGWYVPPPDGIAVLFATADAPNRIRFRSLREPLAWPGSATLDWSDGLMYAFASPIDRETGRPGDFAVTLYFGSKPEVIDHFRHCHRAVRDLVDAVQPAMTASDLFAESVRIFTRNGLANSIVGYHDPGRRDVGHSIPTIDQSLLEQDVEADDRLPEYVRLARRFLTEDQTWRLSEEQQVSIEPQLVSVARPSLPQVGFHYLVDLGSGVAILDECDAFLERFALVR